MEQIRNFEKHITENGTIVLKFFHISGRSRGRLLRRLEEKTQLEVLSGDLKKENDGMITCSITKKQLTILLQTTPGM
jgi:hypothetical protein